MLTVSNLSKAFGGRLLFQEATLQINRRDRLGLVGPNGAGKTTLLSMILGTEPADAGKVDMERGVRIGYLPQENVPVGDETVGELAAAASEELSDLRQQMKALEAGEASGDDHDAHVRFQELGGYATEAKARQILKGLGFRDHEFDRPARELSGGWVMRAHLARLLVQEPDLLLLDEPTNHLDLETVIWLQSYLQQYPGAILLISHDREFLNRLVEAIVEIRASKLARYTGNYEAFVEQRQARDANQRAAYENQQREITRLMTFVDRFRAKNTKASQAQSKLKQIERMERIELPEAESATIHFTFPQPERSGLKVVTLKDVDHAYGAQQVYKGMDFHAERSQRTVLVGPNGAGKSTLLKLLAGVLEVQAGSRTLGHNVRCGYYSQYRVEMLNPDRTVLEEGLDTPQRITEQFARTVLGCFLFRGDDVFKRVRVLSGGEKSRLALVKLLLDPPNLLLMDEPTTHLDLASVEALVGALEQYQGTLIFISHDVYFIRALASQVVHVRDGRLTPYPGGYQYYLDKTGGIEAPKAQVSSPTESVERPRSRGKDQKRLEAEQRQARSKKRKEQTQRVHELEKKILSLEERQKELTSELEKPETYQEPGRAVALNRELSGVVDDLQSLTAQWEEQSTHLEKLA